MQRPSRPPSAMNAWKVAPYAVVIPCIVLYFVFFYYAAARGFGYSLTDWNGVSANYSFVGLKNYQDALASNALRSTLKFTLTYALVVVVLTNVSGMALALLLDRPLRGRLFFRNLFFMPAVMSSLTIAYVFQQIDYRIITAIGASLGVKTLSNGLLASTTWAPYYVSMIQVWLGTSITTVIYLAGLQTVPHEVLESGYIDGAGSTAVFFKIKLPLMMPAIIINLINTTRSGITAFDIIMGTTKGGPSLSTYSFSMYMYLMYSDLELAYSCAIAIIMFVLFGAIALAQIILLRKREVEM